MDNEGFEEVLQQLEKVEQGSKLNLEPIIETKDLNTERAAGRLTTFISPDGQEYHIRQDRIDRFKRHNKVDSAWIVK